MGAKGLARITSIHPSTGARSLQQILCRDAPRILDVHRPRDGRGSNGGGANGTSERSAFDVGRACEWPRVRMEVLRSELRRAGRTGWRLRVFARGARPAAGVVGLGEPVDPSGCGGEQDRGRPGPPGSPAPVASCLVPDYGWSEPHHALAVAADVPGRLAQPVGERHQSNVPRRELVSRSGRGRGRGRTTPGSCGREPGRPGSCPPQRGTPAQRRGSGLCEIAERSRPVRAPATQLRT